MPFPEDVNRLLRDHEGYTGDGQGGSGALPVGDTSTANRPIYKRDLRELLLSYGDVGDQAEAAQEAAEQAAADAASVVSPSVAHYDTVTGVGGAEAGTIPAYVDIIRVGGYAAIGDGGSAEYQRVGSEPAVMTKFQSADGAWWSQMVDKTIFILSTGQSNMQRHPTYSWAPPGNLWVWNNAQGDPESTGTTFIQAQTDRINPARCFAAKIAQENPGSVVYLLNCAMGGRPIASWLPGAPSGEDVYQNILDNISAALTAAGVGEVSALLWWQGENGGFEGTYAADFETVITRFRGNSWFPRATPTVMFGVTTTARAGENRYDLTNFNLQDIAAAQGAYRKFIDSASFTSAAFWDDNVHMSAVGYREVGELAARAFMGRADFVPKRLLGTAPYLVDADAPALGSGEYQTNASTINLPAATAGILRMRRFNPNFGAQEFEAMTNGRRWKRALRSGTWTAWQIVSGSLVANTQGASAQTVTGTTLTAIGFANQVSDPLSIFDGTNFTPPAGVWQISAAVRFDSGVEVGERLTMSLRNAALSTTHLTSEVENNIGSIQQVTMNGLLIADGTTSYVVAVTGTGAGTKNVQNFGPVTYFHASAVDGGL